MPDWKTIVRQRLAALNLAPAADTDWTDELAQHLEDRYRELSGAGVSSEEAFRQVIAELSDLSPVRAALERHERLPKSEAVPLGDSRRGSVAGDLWRDFRYALRTMRKSPVFVVFVVLTLALGIGANTTVFTLINTLILNPLPVPDSAGLASIARAETAATAKSGAPMPLSHADLEDYRARNQVFLTLAGYTAPRIVTLQDGGASERMFAELVTGNYFEALALKPARGRFFAAEEDGAPGARPVAILNYGTWQTRFGGAADVVGRTLRLNNLAFTIVGVAPPHFIGVNAIFGPDLWIPASMSEILLPVEMRNALTDRTKAVFQSVGRLRPGVAREQAQANLASIAAALAREYPAADEGHTVAVHPIRDVVFGSAGSGASPVVFAGAALLVVVGIVLLIACSNVANLMLARSAVRRQEMAVRLAMGASRARLVRQLLTESVLLGLLSGALGLSLGYAGLQVLFGTLPGSANFAQPKLDATVFLFALLVSLATGLLFGALPAFKTSRTGLATDLKEDSRTAGRSRGRVTVANALLVAQVAFSFLLLITAALFLRSIRGAYQMDPGFQTAHLAVFMTNPGQAGYDKPRAKAFYRDVRERLARMPGIESASWSSNLPLWARPVEGVQVEGREQRSRSDKLRSIVTTVDRDYFAASGVTLESGRVFTGIDQETTTPVAIVNRKMAQDYWPGGAIGKRIQLPGEKPMRQIIGVARTANYTGWGEPPQACIYVPFEQSYFDAMTLFVRSKGDPHEMLAPVEREVRAAGPQILVSSTRTGSEIVDGGLFQAKMGVALLTIFGLLALGLASIGLYGILAYSVNQRRREIGLRMALGASPASVLRMVLQQGMSLVLAGVLVGFGAALLVGRLLSRMLYGVGAGDPLSVAAAALMLSLVALPACYLPARWATRVDPLTALRDA